MVLLIIAKITLVALMFTLKKFNEDLVQKLMPSEDYRTAIEQMVRSWKIIFCSIIMGVAAIEVSMF
jgi:hypothetical protein